MMPTGWRPADVAEKYPAYKISDVYDFEKYETNGGSSFIAWAWVQLVVLLLLLSYMFGNIKAIGSPGIFIYGGFIFLFVYSFTELLDRNPHAWIWEFLKNIYALGIIYYLGNWFGISRYFSAFNYIFIAYFVLSMAMTFFFLFADKQQQKTDNAIFQP